MILEGWERHPVGELCSSIVPGRNKPKSFDGNIPWVTTPEIHGRYLPSSLQKNYVSHDALQEAGGKVVPQGAVVMAAVGELGLIAIAKEQIVLNQQLHAFVCSDKIYNEFLAYWLSTQKQYMESIASKTTIPYLNKTNCESIPVNLPPIKEQKKIAQILSTWDKAIITTEELLENSQKQKQALMQHLLTGKKRFSSFSGDWANSKIQSLVTISKGAQLNRDGLIESDIYAVINGGISPSGYTDKPNTKANTITISEGGNSCGYVALQKYDFWCGGHCYALNNIKLPLIFLYQLLKFNETKIMRLRVGSGLPNIQKKDLQSLNLRYPVDYEEQMKIGAVLSTADEKIKSIEKKLDLLKEEKKALMQQLLTGKKRVKLEG